MPVSLDDVATISRAVVAEQSPEVERITIVSTSADGHRVELLVRLGKYRVEQPRFLLNVSRQEPAAFERQLRAKLREVRHQSRPASSRI